MMRTFALAFGLWAISVMPAGAQTFEDPSQEQRFRDLVAELRCLVCQNQSLADSDAELAQDLRREVEQMILAGASDKEIVEFLVARYGDFVLYRPPLKLTTVLLWFGPFILCVGGLWFLIVQLRRRRATAPVAQELSESERERLAAMLGDIPDSTR